MAETQKHFQILRSKTIQDDLAAAKSVLEAKLTGDNALLPGEPAIAYYHSHKGEANDKVLALMAVGGPASGSAIFYNSVVVDANIAALGSQISGSTADSIDEKLTLNALKNYIETKAGAAATEVVSGNGIRVSSINGTSGQTIYTVTNNVELKYHAPVVAAEGVEAKAAYIELADKSNPENNFGTIDVADIIGNGMLQDTKYDKNTGILALTFETASGATQTVEVNLGEMLDINDVAISAASQNYLSVTLNASASESGNSQAVFAAKIGDVSGATAGLADAKDVHDVMVSKIADEAAARNLAISTAISGLDSTVSAETTYSSVKVVEADGKLTSVELTNNIQAVADAGGSAKGYAEASDVKAYVDTQVANKNVTAEGDAYVAASAADNKVTVKANISGLTVSKVVDADSTISGVANSLVDGSEIASKVQEFVNDRLGEEIGKLDVTETTVSATNVSFKYSETDGKVNVSGLTVEYATVKFTPANSEAAAEFEVSNGEKLVTGTDVKAAADYADALMTAEQARVAALTATVIDTNTLAQDGDNLTVSVTTKGGNVTAVSASITSIDCGEF